MSKTQVLMIIGMLIVIAAEGTPTDMALGTLIAIIGANK